MTQYYGGFVLCFCRYVSGDWDNYTTKRALVKSDSGLALIVDVPAGQHRYHFEVDGRWMVDPEKPTTRTINGDAFNVCTAEQVGEFSTKAEVQSSSPPGDYGQEIRDPPPAPDRSKRRGNPNEPPMLPPHLLRALLNAQSSTENPVLLPLPHHVMLNHLYVNKSREKDGIYIHGVTCRYKTKYVTYVLYKPT
jgi:5'-AMP-activated protein kinase, regulatory beta subunit